MVQNAIVLFLTRYAPKETRDNTGYGLGNKF